jgi:hypothetical protein
MAFTDRSGVPHLLLLTAKWLRKGATLVTSLALEVCPWAGRGQRTGTGKLPPRALRTPIVMSALDLNAPAAAAGGPAAAGITDSAPTAVDLDDQAFHFTEEDPPWQSWVVQRRSVS